jgi:hypothetical protein
MPWAVAAAGVSAAAGLGSAAMQSSAVGGASKAQQQMAQLQRDDMRTWRDTGGQANTQAANLLGINGQDAADAAFGTFRTESRISVCLGLGIESRRRWRICQRNASLRRHSASGTKIWERFS